MQNPNPRVFFDLQIGGYTIGRVIMELYADLAPRTAENFRSLCTGEHGTASSGFPLHYKYSTIHTVIPGIFFQGGDFDERGGESIYGTEFEVENFPQKLADPFCLSMVKTTRNTIASQFRIYWHKGPEWDGDIVVFGRVVKGFHVLKKLERVGSESGETIFPVVIADCGELY